MSDVFDFHAGERPLLVSVPHDGRVVPDDISERMTNAGRRLPDTDWHVARLYELAPDIGASMIVARYSRYVVDLNRPSDDAALYPGQLATGICPIRTFAGDAIYADEGPDDAERASRIERYWRPYHDRLARSLADIRQRFGYVLLWDAHSIPSRVPSLFEGVLPELNLGSNDGASAGAGVADAVMAVVSDRGFDGVLDGRFKGGYITRHYGAPQRGIHALQLEIAQRAYMDEATGCYAGAPAERLWRVVQDMLDAAQDAAAGFTASSD